MLRRCHSFIAAILPVSLVIALAPLGCSGSDAADDGPNGSGGRAGTPGLTLGGAKGLGAVGTGGSAVVGQGGGEMCTIEDDGSGCVGQAYRARASRSTSSSCSISPDRCAAASTSATVIGGPCPDPDCNATRMMPCAKPRALHGGPESHGVA